MMDANCSLLYLIILLLLFPNIALGTHLNKVENGVNIGAILDCTTRVGKEERVAMEMAIQDLDKRLNQKLFLRLKCSRGRPLHAAQAARYLIKRSHVKAIVGPNSWEESSAVAEVCHKLYVPILSFYGSTPLWATKNWPFFIQASPTTSNQMKAIVAMIQSWRWSKVNVIYEDSGHESSCILNHLYGALKHDDVQVSQLLPLTSFASSKTLHDELGKLKRGQTRVFILHSNSLDLAQRVFGMANEMNMMEKGYVWITTHSITSLVHSMNTSVISSMEGVLGVMRSFPDIKEGFNNRFTARFGRIYPEEKNLEPGIFALQAYDAVWALGLAVKDGKETLKSFEGMDFTGVSGKMGFKDRRLGDVAQFQIINVVGKSYRELGFWSEELGFSRVLENTTSYNSSMEILGPVFWPGGPWSPPRGWELPMTSKPMRIGVPNGTLLNKFVKVDYDPINKKNNVTGFAVDVLEKIMQKLSPSLPYVLIPFNGDYNDLVKRVHSKYFDAAVGDITILSGRYDYVEFTHAYTESGLVMVVPNQAIQNQNWLFLKPFTTSMWFFTVFITVYNGFVVWRIEIDHSPAEIRESSFLSQITSLFYLAFGTLFSLHGERLNSSLSKMATVVWLFVALIITQSYTASLTSMLTLQNIGPKITNVETLRRQNANIGYTNRSFVKDYLLDSLKWNPNHIKNFTKDEAYADALRHGEIAAAFLEVPDAKLFVAKYCKSFTIAGPTYMVGGFGFAFQKGSSMVDDIDKALLSVFESGTLKEMEEKMMESEKCVDIQVDNDTVRLSPRVFLMPFVMTGATSTTVLIIYYFRNVRKLDNSSMAQHTPIWLLMSLVLKKWRNQRSRSSCKVSDVAIETSPQHTPNPS